MKKILLFVTLLISTLSTLAQEDPKGLKINDKAPTFTATDQEGKTVSLEQQLAKGPVVLVFYRGQWCPYCNRFLRKLEDSLTLVMEKGASLLAITPEKPENISQTVEKTNATFPILYDEGLKIMKSYDVAFAVDEKTVERYKNHGIDFTIANGMENGANLPVPAVYVINKQGKIVYRHFDKDYTKRAPVTEILKHLGGE